MCAWQSFYYLSDGGQTHYVAVFKRREHALVLEHLSIHPNHKHIMELRNERPYNGIGALKHLNEMRLRVLGALNHLLHSVFS